MTSTNQLTRLIELSLISLLSTVAIYSFSNSSVFTDFEELVAEFYSIDSLYLSALIVILLIIAGLALIIIKNKPFVGGFVGLAALFCAPSLLAHSSAAMGWFKVLDIESSVVETNVAFLHMMLIMFFIVSTYILLRYVTWFDQMRFDATQHGGNAKDLGDIYIKKLVSVLILIAGAFIVSVLIGVFAHELRRIIGGRAEGVPPAAIVSGLILSLVIMGVIYWLLVRVRSSYPQLMQDEVEAIRASLFSGQELSKAGYHEEANHAFREAVEIGKISGSSDIQEMTARASLNLAFNLEDMGKVEEINGAYRDAIEMGSSSDKPGGYNTAATAALNLGANLEAIGEVEAANETYQQSIEMARKCPRYMSNETGAAASFNLAKNLDTAGKWEEANRAYREAIDMGTACGTSDGQDTVARAALNLGLNLEEEGKTREAHLLFHEAIAMGRACGTPRGLSSAKYAAEKFARKK